MERDDGTGLCFEEPEAHALLRETARGFLAEALPPRLIRELEAAGAPVPEPVWRRLAELGWLGIPVPREHGGSDEDVLTFAVLLEEVGRAWASLASDLVLVSMAARLFRQFGSDEQRAAILPGIAAGTLRVAFSLTEPSGGTDVLSGSTRASLEGGEWVVRGQKLYTSRAPEADFFVVLARTDEGDPERRARGWSLLLLPAGQDAIEVRKLSLLGNRSAGTSEVFYDGARAPAGALVGERGRGFYHLIASLNNERIAAAAIGVGIARAAFDEALRYAGERTAFGRPIGAFQAIQHSLADTATEIEMVRLLVQKAAWLESRGRDCSTAAAMANVAAGELAVRATDRGMRVLAGHGMTEDSPMERFLRDARLQVVSPVSNEMGRNVIGERLGLPRSY